MRGKFCENRLKTRDPHLVGGEKHFQRHVVSDLKEKYRWSIHSEMQLQHFYGKHSSFVHMLRANFRCDVVIILGLPHFILVPVCLGHV